MTMTTTNDRPARVQRIAETITDLWPHRMSGQAADLISRTFGDGIALLHSELSEALEAYRDWGTADATATLPVDLMVPERKRPTPKPEGVGSEFADVLIRLLDESDRQGIDLEAEYRRKIAYNRTRSYRHGGRTL